MNYWSSSEGFFRLLFLVKHGEWIVNTFVARIHMWMFPQVEGGLGIRRCEGRTGTSHFLLATPWLHTLCFHLIWLSVSLNEKAVIGLSRDKKLSVLLLILTAASGRWAACKRERGFFVTVSTEKSDRHFVRAANYSHCLLDVNVNSLHLLGKTALLFLSAHENAHTLTDCQVACVCVYRRHQKQELLKTAVSLGQLSHCNSISHVTSIHIYRGRRSGTPGLLWNNIGLICQQKRITTSIGPW